MLAKLGRSTHPKSDKGRKRGAHAKLAKAITARVPLAAGKVRLRSNIELDRTPPTTPS
jgi:hypothetical protein